ncbi:MAG: ATP-binding protein [Thermodesulfobacteriota bacterium]
MGNRHEKYDKMDIKRRKREGIIIFVTAVLIVLLTYIELHISDLSSKLPLSNNVLVFSLININIILLILLVFLVFRNFVKIFSEMRMGVIGSRFRTKLVLAFVGLSLIPTILLFFIAAGFITKSIEGWFSMGIERPLKESLEVAQSYYKEAADRTLHDARQIGQGIEEKGFIVRNDESALRLYLEEQNQENNLSSVEVFSKEGIRITNVITSEVIPGFFPEVAPDMVKMGIDGDAFYRVETTEVGDIVRAVVPIYRSDSDIEDKIGVIVASYYVPESLMSKMRGISAAFEEYEQLKLLKNPIKASYFITLLVITLVIVFLSTWVGLYLAKGITVPIQRLAEGTHAVASGDLDYHIAVESDDEVGTLVRSFNQMTSDLKASKVELEDAYLDLKTTNLELDQRRKYMEIVLRDVAAGVISIDKTGRISTINKAAEEILGINTKEVIGKGYKEVMEVEHLEVLRDMIRALNNLGTESIEKQLKLAIKDKTLTVLINLTLLKDDDGRYLGMVAVFDDLTQIIKGQRMMAWREVAKRIAHEIKNPLTPIQLSAQRLRKKYGSEFPNDGQVFDECTKTIIRQVRELKTLVDEFSSFARMPAARPLPSDLNRTVKEAVSLYKEAHRDIKFISFCEENMPVIGIDRDQIKRAIINLLDNSVDSIKGEGGEIEVKTVYDPDLEIAKIEVSDTGCGISREDRFRLFEPYFSTKSSGTGLGLAIVSNIVADHQGYIRVKANLPRGTRFIIELPVNT